MAFKGEGLLNLEQLGPSVLYRAHHPQNKNSFKSSSSLQLVILILTLLLNRTQGKHHTRVRGGKFYLFSIKQIILRVTHQTDKTKTDAGFVYLSNTRPPQLLFFFFFKKSLSFPFSVKNYHGGIVLLLLLFFFSLSQLKLYGREVFN